MFVIVVLGPFVADVTANGASRAALTAALVEHHSVDISSYGRVLGVDHAEGQAGGAEHLHHLRVQQRQYPQQQDSQNHRKNLT